MSEHIDKLLKNRIRILKVGPVWYIVVAIAFAVTGYIDAQDKGLGMVYANLLLIIVLLFSYLERKQNNLNFEIIDRIFSLEEKPDEK
ncbi:hypothetical protein ACFL6G_07880 [candidate division KSB1 bacterium]